MNENSTKVVTGKVRFCYVNVFEPTAMNEGDEKKYNICILIPKEDKVTLEKVKRQLRLQSKLVRVSSPIVRVRFLQISSFHFVTEMRSVAMTQLM